ncbi:MAG: hypothetical protein ACI8RP_000384, partial [Urechidicola sp.]
MKTNFNKLNKIIFIVLFALVSNFTSAQQDYFWVGGSGTWTELNHWAKTSGGTDYHNIVPTPIDKVIFDANSFSADGQKVVVNYEALCDSFVADNLGYAVDFDFNSNLRVKYNGINVNGDITWQQDGEITVSNGDMVLGNGVKLTMGNYNFLSSNGNLILNGNANFYINSTRTLRKFELTNGTIKMNSSSTFHFQGSAEFISGKGDLIVASGANFYLNSYHKYINKGNFIAQGNSTVHIGGRYFYIKDSGFEIDATVNYTMASNERFEFSSTISGGQHNIKSGGNNLRRVEFNGTNHFTEYRLQDDIQALNDGLFIYANKFISNGKEIDVYHFYCWTGGVVDVDLTGTNQVKLVSQFRLYPSTNTTVNMGTANILWEGTTHQYLFAGKNVVFNDLHFNSLSTGGTLIQIQYNTEINNIKVDAAGDQRLNFYNNTTVNNFTWNYTKNSGTVPDLYMTGNKTFNGSFTVNSSGTLRAKLRSHGINSFNEFNIAGGVRSWEIQSSLTNTFNDIKPLLGSCDQPILVSSHSLGAQGTISQANGIISGDFLQLQDVKAVGGATYNATNTADLGNVTGWNISPITPKDFYWVGNNGNWADANNWSLTSGGAPYCAIPSRIDNVFFDTNSFTSSNQYVNVNAQAECYNMDWTGTIANAGMNGNQLLEIYGSLKLASNMNFSKSGIIEFEGIDAHTVDTAGKTIPSEIKFQGQNQTTGSWDLQSDLISTSNLRITRGTFNANGHNVDVASFYSSTSNVNFTNGTSLVKVQSKFDCRSNTNLNMGIADILFESSSNMYFENNNGHAFNNITFNSNNTGKTWLWIRSNLNNTFKNFTINRKGKTHTYTENGIVYSYGRRHQHYSTWYNNRDNQYENVVVNNYNDAAFYMTNSYRETMTSLSVNYLGTGTYSQKVYQKENCHTNDYGDLTISGENNMYPHFESNNNFLAKSVNLDHADYMSMNPNYTYSFGEININGNCSNRTRLKSNTGGVQVPIVTANAVTTSYAVIKDINASGTGPFSFTNSLDGGNVTGWSITSDTGNLYWVGGAGNWSDANHWSLTSGGPSASCIPSQGDNVFFDVNSFTAPNQSVNVDVVAYCQNMVWNNVNSPEITGNKLLNVYGSMVLAPNLEWNQTGETYFQSRGIGNTITTNGVEIDQVQFLSDGSYAGKWTLRDNLSVTNDIYINNGSFISGGFNISSRSFYNANNNSQISIDFAGTDQINVRNDFEIQPNTNFNIGDANIRWDNMTLNEYSFLGGNKTYKDLTFVHDDGPNPISLSGNNSIRNVLIETTAYPQVNFNNNANYNDISILFENNSNNVPNVIFSGNNTLNVFSSTSIGNAGPYITFNNSNNFIDLVASGLGTRLILAANHTQTVSGALALGNGSFPVFVKSNTEGVQATLFLPTGQLCLEFVLLQDIKGSANSGTGTNGLSTEFFAGSSSVDLGNNTNFQFTHCLAYYWVGDSGDWSDYGNHWATTSGGTFFHVSAPGPEDDVFFDANSFTTNGSVVNVDVANAEALRITWQSALFTPTFTGNTAVDVYGDLELITLMNQDFIGNWNFLANDEGNIINTSVHSINEANFNGADDGEGEWILQNDLNVTGDINLNNGTLNTNNKNISVHNFNSSTDKIRSLVLGSSEITINNGSWNPSTLSDTALEEGTSTIFVKGDSDTSSFLGNSLTYNNVTFTTQNILDASLTGTNSFNRLQIDKGLTLTVEPTTQTMAQLIANGACDKIIIIKSSGSGSSSNSIFSQVSGTTNTSYLDISNNIGTGGATFNADYSIDSGNNTGWNFTEISNLLVTINTGDVDCELNNDGFAEVTAVTGGSGPYTYLWSTTETTAKIENLIPGSYNVTVTDASNCAVAYEVAVINEPSVITSTPFTTSETDICIGTAINFMAGTPPETVTSYIWDFGDFTNSTDQNPSHTYAEHGSYTVSLSYLDDFGCPAIVTQTIQVSDIETNLTKTDVNCFGNNNGSIEIEATGGIGAYQYSINNGVDYFDSGIFNNLEPGTYNVIAIDDIQCETIVQTVNISQPLTSAAFTFSTVGISCSNNEDGIITVNATGGSAPYDYSRNNGISFQASNTFEDLPFGSYNLVVRDDNNCIVEVQVASISLEITAPDNISTFATSAQGAVVNYTTPAAGSDNCSVTT